ncbi:MAG: hypothetical protein ABIG20_05545 [archaeon]
MKTSIILLLIILIAGCVGSPSFTADDGGKIRVSGIDMPLDTQEACMVMEEYQGEALDCSKVVQVTDTYFSYELYDTWDEESPYTNRTLGPPNRGIAEIGLNTEKMTIETVVSHTM